VVGIIIFYIVFHFLSVWFSLLFVICILLRFFLCFPYLTGGHVKQTTGWKEESTLNVRHHLERMSSRGVDRVDFSVPLCLSSRDIKGKQPVYVKHYPKHNSEQNRQTKPVYP
jgi:hypothetical protein